MGEKTRTAERRLRDHSPQVEAVRRELERASDGRPQVPVQELAQLFLRRAPDAFVRGRSISDLTRVTLGVFDFLDRSKPDKVHVSVFNPSLD